MIRRGFWLAVGATGGIIGYRRVVSLGRSLSGTLMLTRGAEPDQQTTPAGPQRGALGPRGTTGTAAAPRSASRKRQAARGLTRQTIRLSRDARRFSRDVRAGMDLYIARHPGQSGPTLSASTDNRERAKDDR